MSADWGAPTLPQGGLVTAVAVRAMLAELGAPEQRLRSVTTVYADQVRAGPLEIDVAVLRRGRSLSQLVATVRNAGEASGHTSVAVFGNPRPGFEFTDVSPPTVPPPEACRSFRDPPPPTFAPRMTFPYWDHVEGRAAIGHAPWDDWEPTTSERAYWYRFDDPPLTADGVLDPCAVVTLCDTMPGAVGERMGPGLPFWLPPSADLTVHLLADAGPGWLLSHNRARWAGDGYASVEMALWDGPRLVAHATQVMVFLFPDGPPSPAERRPRPRA
ncbi:MAG TPA: thioesterase family protein [Candidatus Binatia bacterium]|nr:thioesterase family protein [Candidatus Binatia bacterium]